MRPHRMLLATVVVALVAAAGLVATLATHRVVTADRDDRTARHLDAVAHRLRQNDAWARVNLRGLQALFAASERVREHEFLAFAGIVMDRQPEISAIAYLQRVRPAQRRDWLGRSGAIVAPPGTRPAADPLRDAYPVTFARVVRRTYSSLGMDMSLNPDRRRAMTTARDTGGPGVTVPIMLAGLSDAGIAYYAAVYASTAIPTTVARRRARVAGFVVVAQRSAAITRLLARELPPGTAFSVTDGGRPVAGAGTVTAAAAVRSLDMAGRVWWVRVAPDGSGPQVPTIVAALASTAALLAVIVWVVGGVRRERVAAVQMALRSDERDDARRALHDSQDMQRVVLESTADAVLTMDPATGLLITANRAATALVGWSADELAGMPVDRVLDPTGPPTPGGSGGQERAVVHRDGHRIPALVAWAHADVDGRPVRVAIVHDISIRRRAEDAVRSLAAEQAALLRVATAAAGGENERAVLDRVAQEAGMLVGADRVDVLRREPGDATVRVMGGWGHVPGPATGDVVPFERVCGAVATALRTGCSARVRRETGEGMPLEAGVCAPVLVDGAVWGFLAAGVLRGASLADGAEASLERLAHLTGLAVAASQARRELAAMATTDHLTGLGNRRAFHDRLDEELERARRDRRPLSLVVLDLDHFKRINDTLGHAAGDRVLAEVARRLRTLVGTGQTLARIGGEEFGWILPDTDGMTAYLAAERARRAVGVPLAGVGRVTLSAGVCDTGEAGEAGQLFRLADMALYWAKDAGRNRGVRYTRDTAPLMSRAAPHGGADPAAGAAGTAARS